MRFIKTLMALTVALALAGDAAAQSKGKLKITGRVLDEAGKPVAGATVRAAKKTEPKPEVFSAQTNDKGEYTIKDVAAGEWVFEATKEGVVGKAEGSATLTEANKTTTVDLTIGPPKPDPNVEIQSGHQQAIQLWQQGKPAEAKKIYEDLLAKYPTVYQLQVPLANIYADEKNYTKAVELMKVPLEKEPENTDWVLMNAELLMEGGQKDEASKILQAVDLTKVKDPRAFINLAINDINAGKPEGAIELLTKLMVQFPNDASLLYYRGKAYIAATKLPEAKADLEKFVATAPPAAPQLADAKKLLEQLNKK